MSLSKTCKQDFLCDLFKNSCMTSDLQELQAYDAETMSPEVSASILSMLQKRKDMPTTSKKSSKPNQFQTDLDVLILTGIFEYKLGTKLSSIGFQIHKEHLLQQDSLKDIGVFIRRLLLRWPMQNVLFKLYQYSMPFIKHNRLNFPAIHNVSDEAMMHMLQVMQMTCLGLHKNASKQPTWKIRGKLYFFFQELTSRGSYADLHRFCQSHIYMLRVSLIENFITFLEENMPIEKSLLHQFIDVTYDHQRVSKMLYYVIDNFRQTSFQDEVLNWNLIEERAQQTIERCNRTCKSMPNFKKHRASSVFTTIDLQTFEIGMTQQKLNAQKLYSYIDKYDLFQLSSLHDFYGRIQIYNLPLHIQMQQFATTMENGRYLHQQRYNSLMYICMRCNEKNPTAVHNMRLHYHDKPTCVHCNSKNFVFGIQTLGRLVRVHHTYYYFCIFCQHHHVWNSNADEFFQCSTNHNPRLTNKGHGGKAKDNSSHARSKNTCDNSLHTSVKKIPKHCVVCLRTMQISMQNVFDNKLGVFQSFYLCHKHSSHASKMAYVKNLSSMRKLIEFTK